MGIVTLAKALIIAKDAHLDLVEVSPATKHTPSVCKVMNYGKYQFELKKKKNAAKKNQKQMQVKEVKFRPATDIGDYQVKLRNLIRFLESGDKVKVSVMFRGRELAHQEFGRQMLERIEEDVQEYGAVEFRPKMEGRQLLMIIVPKKKTVQ